MACVEESQVRNDADAGLRCFGRLRDLPQVSEGAVIALARQELKIQPMSIRSLKG